MFCKFCGKEIEEDSNVCLYCGKQLRDVSLSVDGFSSQPDVQDSINESGIEATNEIPAEPQKTKKKRGRWILRVIEIIIIYCIATRAYAIYKDHQFIKYAKAITNDKLSDKTYGEAFDEFSTDPEWKVEERKGDKASVSVRGDYEEGEYIFYFDVEVDGDKCTVAYDKLYLGDEKQNEFIGRLFLMVILQGGETGEEGEEVEEQSEIFENEGDLSGSHIVIQDCCIDYENDEPVAIITYQFKNGTDSKAGFTDLFSTFVSQNGVELEENWLMDGDDYFHSTNVEPGVEYTYKKAYKLRDMESDLKVSVEAQWDISDAKDTVEKTFSLTANEQKEEQAEEETKTEEAETEKEAAKIEEPDFGGTWYDVYSQRCHMEITSMNDIYYEIIIDWGSGAWDNAHWELLGEYDAEKGGIVYTGEYIEQHYSDDGECTEDVIYDDGTGVISMKDGVLYWDDQKANAGENCVFERGE